jgi:hypothetical protein
MGEEKIFCERCGEKLNAKKAVWLELSLTDGNYYTSIPAGHLSQGEFSFGSACSKTQLKETWTKTASKITAAKL